MAKETVFCPNCGRRAEQSGTNKIYCEICDTEFKITPAGAKVENLGKLADIEKRVAALEGKTPAEDPPDDHQEDPPDDHQEDPQEEEEEEEDII